MDGGLIAAIVVTFFVVVTCLPAIARGQSRLYSEHDRIERKRATRKR